MARFPRIKVTGETAWYHVCARVAGWLDWYPFDDPGARDQLEKLIRKYLRVFCCEVAAFCLMGNHYHLVLCFEPFRKLSKTDLLERARYLYKNPESVLVSEKHWERFNERIFDMSELMRSLQAEYARWYNKSYNRRGSFWGERFRSVLLGQGESVLDAILYVELNPVRAGLVDRPEEWIWNSANRRLKGEARWMVPLDRLIPIDKDLDSKTTYKALLYYRGGIEEATDTTSVETQLSNIETKTGFRGSGAFSSRLRFFTYGLMIGSEQQVREWLEHLRANHLYQRRRNPLSHQIGDAIFYSLGGVSTRRNWPVAFP